MLVYRGRKVVFDLKTHVILAKEDEREILALLLKVDPVQFENMVVSFRDNDQWVGIREAGKLVSVVGGQWYEDFGHVRAVYTDPAFVGLGHATHLVSQIVTTILEQT
ncbi:MAG: GNAT family N-acetyltransferase, partial [Candidatus Lokiarchaeota archaeon]|nr:GNAT family N-acetyltransferase [Candidatus Lokiarchaeota archaeon]